MMLLDPFFRSGPKALSLQYLFFLMFNLSYLWLSIRLRLAPLKSSFHASFARIKFLVGLATSAS